MVNTTIMLRYIAVFKDHWEVRNGTELDMDLVLDEYCDDGSFINEKGTTVPGVWMLYQDGYVDETMRFPNPFSGPFSVYGQETDMNFVLVGFDDYTDEEEASLRKMSNDEQQRYYEEHPLAYRSLTDEEIAQCVHLLEEIPAPEKTVFLSGSQTCMKLPEEVKARLDYWMIKHAWFVIGDCKGADALMQQYLHEKGYQKVIIHVSGDEVRHNAGDWEVTHCHTLASPHTYEFYKVKDECMAEIADEALAVWDGETVGTRENIIAMRQQGKNVTIFLTNGGGCREEYSGNLFTYVSDVDLAKELKRYGEEENICVASAVKCCPRAEQELHLKRDEVFMLQRVLPNGQPDPGAPSYPPFLSFKDVLAVIRDEMVQRDPSFPAPSYVLEKWASKGCFNLTFFRFRDELIEVTPPDEDYHMEQTAHFDLEGDEVVSFHLVSVK